MMHDKAMHSLSAVISSLICGTFIACAGGDTPPVNDEFEAAIAQGFRNGAVAAAGAGGRAPAPAPSGGSSGSASTPAAGSGGAGSGDEADPPPTAAAGASSAEPPPPSGGACDGFAVLQTNCGSSACHGEGGIGDFAASAEAARAYVGTSGSVTCATEGPLLNPENPRQSIIVQKVNGTVPCGQAMPIGADPLTDAEISCLEEWIGTL